MRTPGFYWIKILEHWDWEVAEWDGQVWLRTGDDEVHIDEDVYIKDEEQIIK